MRSAALDRWPAGVGWLTAAAVAVVVAINLAGIVGIAVARRGVLEDAARGLRLETAARARSIEAVLASTRADLTFLASSPVLFDLEAALASRDPRLARFRRLEAEGGVLLFLRGHPEAMRVVVRSAAGVVLLEAARRGGVPVLWRSGPGERAPAAPRREIDPVGRPITAVLQFVEGTRTVSGAVTMEATIDAPRLLLGGQTVEAPGRLCDLRDGRGETLAAEGGGSPPEAAARQAGGSGASRGEWIVAEAEVAAADWSAPAPWSLTCARRRAATLGALGPLAERYGATLVLNLVVMSLALLLGALAIQQVRRRHLVEAGAREESRVRELERRLFHAERLTTVGRFAAGIAHEINNPLEGMANYLGLAREELGRGEVASARQRLDGVREGLERAVSIVRQVLAHADPATAPKVPQDLNAILAQTADFVRSRPEFGAIRFHLELADGLPRVLGSQAMLGQAFLNLIVNACEAQPRGGEVRVTSSREGAMVVVEIADRGPGIPPAEAERIFEPFHSTKNSTGLGLSICDSITAQHGGDLSVVAREGRGAIFRMRLPAAGQTHA